MKELDIRNKYNVNVIAIQKKTDRIDDDGKVVHDVMMNDLPGPNDVIEEGNVLVIVGADSDIEKLALASEES